MRVSRGVLHDLYVEDLRAAVMVGEEVIVLSELATSIVLTVPESGETTSLESVTATLVEQYGEPEPPDDATALAREQILELAAHDILVIDDGRTRTASKAATESEALLAVHGALGAVMRPTTERWALPPDVADEQFLAIVARQRVGSQLVTGLGRLDLPDLLAARLRAHSEGAAAACRTLTTDTHRALGALNGAGIQTLVFKGMPLSVQAWGDESARGYGDIDLLVRPAEVGAACACLARAGWDMPSNYPAPGSSWAWQQFVRQDYELPMSSGPSAIDLHWHLTPFRSTTPGFDELWQRRSTVLVGERPVATLSAYDALAHSASHSARDHWRWVRGLADVHRLAVLPQTWAEADHPLRRDQLTTLGLAARMFGVPDSAPKVVREAVDLSGDFWAEALRRQVDRAVVPENERLPGVQLKENLESMWLTHASLRDYVRHVVRSTLPPWRLAEEASPHAWVAAPRVLGRRLGEVKRRWRTEPRT